MRSIARLSLRALYCEVALKSGIHFKASSGVSISKGSSRLAAASINNCSPHSASVDSSISMVDTNLHDALPNVDLIENKKPVGLCDFDCNILHKHLVDDKDRYISSANEVGIKYFVVPGSSLAESQSILDLAKVETRIRLLGTAGIHPYSAVKDDFSENNHALLEALVAEKECYAVGECGLDYSEGFPDKAPQIEWFRFHVSLALRHLKPLYLHSRDAEEDFLGVLTEFGFGQSIKPAVPCCVHCFTGTTEELQRYLNCGFFIGLTGFIIKMDDDKLLLWLQMITLDRLVIETDAPYMGFKGCRSTEISDRKRTYPNVPVALLKVLDRICNISGWTAAEDFNPNQQETHYSVAARGQRRRGVRRICRIAHCLLMAEENQ